MSIARMAPGTTRRSPAVEIALAVALALAVSAARAQAGDPKRAGRGGPGLVLDRNSYFRTCTQFGLMRLSSDALKADGQKLLGRRLGRLQRYTRQLLRHRNIDWEKTDWRDEAVYHFTTGQVGHDAEAIAALAASPPPAGWTTPAFDDSGFDRQRLGIMTLCSGGDAFREAQGLLRHAQFVRTCFELPDPAAAGELTVQVTYRGGARVFVNGEEIGRRHLPAGRTGPGTLAEDYPLEAYLARADELPPKHRWGDFIGDLRVDFDSPLVRRADRTGEFRLTYGQTVLNRKGWKRLMGLRDRVLGPIRIPRRLLRKGRNVLAIEVRTSRYHPVILPGARGSERNWGGAMHVNVRWDHCRLVNVELRAANAGAVPSANRRPAGMQVWVDDLHARLYTADFNPPGWPVGTARFVGGRNGTYAAQLAVGTDKDLAHLAVVCGELRGPGGAVIPASAMKVGYLRGHPITVLCQLGQARSFPVELRGLTTIGEQALYRYSDGANLYGVLPKNRDAAERARAKFLEGFRFFDHISDRPPQTVPAGSCQPIWLSLRIPDDAAAGRYRGTVTVRADGQEPVAVPVAAEVINWRVPDPRQFQTIVQSEQSPYGVAKHYKVPLWSDRHFELMATSFRHLARLGNDWVYVPVLMNTELGNRQDQMIRWIRRKDGSLTFDYSIMDRYLALAARVQGRPRIVCFLVMHGANSTTSAVRIHDEATGASESVEIGPRHDATRRPLWRAFARSLIEHMRPLDLEDAIWWGQAFDDVPDKSLIPVLAEVAPHVYWACAGHGRAPDETFRVASRAYGVDLRPGSSQGWKNPYVHLLMARTAGSVICVEGICTPFAWRVMCDRAIHTGFNGLGRLGADYFHRTWFDGFSGGYWNMVGRACVQTLWPGEAGVDSSVRHEITLEGIQEAEVRIYLEQMLDRRLLPDDLAREVETVLEDHFLATIHLAAGAIDHQTMDVTTDWQQRSRRLYRTAAKVAERMGIDVDRNEFGETSLTLSCRGQRQTYRGGALTVPALGRIRLPLVLRNWSGSKRTWRASSDQPWIVPERGEDTVTAQQEIGVLLDGKGLQPGATVSGVLTLTDVAAGTEYPVRIKATVEAALDFRVMREIRFVTGGGSGTEMPKLVRVRTRPVFNVRVGGRETKEYALVSRAASRQGFRFTSDCDWVTIEPASGEIAPGQAVRVRLTAAPKHTRAAALTPTIRLTGAGGTLEERHELKVYVLPPYRPPAAPVGRAVYLNELDQGRHMTWHMDAGFTRRTRGPRPWIFSEDPKPYYSRFNRVGHRPEGLRREDHATYPFTMAKKKYTHGLWVSPTHETVYDIAGAGFRAFAAEVGSCDLRKNSRLANVASTVAFEIYVDGRLRTTSGLMRIDDPPRLLVVDGLASARQVKLVTRRDDLIDDWYTVVTWADPRFIKPR